MVRHSWDRRTRYWCSVIRHVAQSLGARDLMARGRTGPWSKYRAARAKLTDLETLRDTFERSRPRTRGKKAAKTRALNKLKRQIPAAKGLLTKARKGIERTRTSRKAS